MELLEAYVLAALADDEWEDVDFHLDYCGECSQQVAQMQRATYLLGQLVPMQAPPSSLREQVLEALPSGRMSTTTSAPVAQSLSIAPRSSLPARLTRILLPLAAVLVLGLFGAATFLNLAMANRMERLESANKEMIQRLDRTAAAEAGILGGDAGSRVADILRLDADTLPMVLESPTGTAGSHGFMLVSEDGRRAVLMLAGMERPRPPWNYNIWLTRDGQRLPLGQLDIDSSGLSTVTLTSPEPLFLFDFLNVTMDRDTSEPASPGEMVLQTKIAGRR